LAEAGKLPLEKKKTNLHKLLNRLTEIFRLEAEENGVQFNLTSSAEDEVLVVDSNRITQVFLNLIGNAIRYTPSGGQVSIHLTEKAGEDRNDLLVSIKDTGIGIPIEHLPYLFNRFYRVEDDRARHSGGMGLGLAITKQFVEAHGGHIEVDSMVGKGTTFTVYLPRGMGE
jgi:two-component system sensor histidine kinase BaeS